MKHRPALDGIRGLAILLVLATHAHGGLPGGHVGVVLFFVLSGYLITSLLLGDETSLRSFYLRRAARLVPALLVALLGLAVLVPTVLGPGYGRTVTLDAIIAGLYLTNVAVSVSGPTFFRLTEWSWSLALEEQFYLLWPFTLGRLLPRLGRRRLASGLVGVAVVVAVVRVAVAAHDPVGAYYAPWTRADAILLGCALALGPSLPRWLAWPGLVALLSVAAVSPAYSPLGLAVGLPIAAVGSGLLVAGQPRLFTWRPLRHLGEISYALYLWDSLLNALWDGSTGGKPRGWAILAWLALSIVAAELSTRFVEQPIRRRVRQLRTTVAATQFGGGVPGPGTEAETEGAVVPVATASPAAVAS